MSLRVDVICCLCLSVSIRIPIQPITQIHTHKKNKKTGHLLAGTIKDTVTRYAHQNGHHVVRRFGWDCHGLPVEFEIDQELGIKDREQVCVCVCVCVYVYMYI